MAEGSSPLAWLQRPGLLLGVNLEAARWGNGVQMLKTLAGRDGTPALQLLPPLPPGPLVFVTCPPSLPWPHSWAVGYRGRGISFFNFIYLLFKISHRLGPISPFFKGGF